MNAPIRLAPAAAVCISVLITLTASAQAAGARKAKAKPTAKDFQYTVSDCHEAGELESLRLEISEDAVAWSQILNMNCIAATRPSTVRLAYAKQGRDLEVSIILRSPVLSDCTCPIGIEGRIGKLGKGTYRLTFVYDRPPGNSANEAPERRTVGSQEFAIQ